MEKMSIISMCHLKVDNDRILEGDFRSSGG